MMILPVGLGRLITSTKSFFPRLNKPHSFSPSGNFTSLLPSSWPSVGLASVYRCLSFTGGSRTEHSTQPSKYRLEENNPFPQPTSCDLLHTQSRMLLAFSVARAHCSLLSTGHVLRGLTKALQYIYSRSTPHPTSL